MKRLLLVDDNDSVRIALSALLEEEGYEVETAASFQDAASRLFLPQALQPERPALTPRELEALRWTMDGKTAWEVGTILGISERTAVLHVNNAMHKLGCVNKHQAVLKALRLGLIH